MMTPNPDIIPEGVHGFEKDLRKDTLSDVTSLIVHSYVDLSIMNKKQPPASDQRKINTRAKDKSVSMHRFPQDEAKQQR